MKSLAVLATVCFIALVAPSSSQPPIPQRYDGYAMGDLDAPLILEGFYDLMCPDCKASWATLSGVLKYFGPSKIRFIFHRFPLPYHHEAFIANQGAAVAVSLGKNPYDWLTAVFAAQNSFSTEATANKTMNQVIDDFSQLAAATLGVSASDFKAGLNDATLNEDTRISWKYGCSRYVSGTPTYLLNGVLAPAESTWTSSQWINFLKTYM